MDVKKTELTHWRFWLMLGIGCVLLVVYLSLTDLRLPELSSTAGDKINHLIAYGFLMGWFGQLFQARSTRAVIAVLLVVLGVTMEIIQGMTGYRYFDWLDALANSLGVVCGLLALHFGAGKILHWFETRVL